MLGIHLERSVLGTTLWFRPGWSHLFTNGKGLGISVILQSPIELHLSLPYRKGSYRTGRVDKTPSNPYTSGTVNEPNRQDR